MTRRSRQLSSLFGLDALSDAAGLAAGGGGRVEMRGAVDAGRGTEGLEEPGEEAALAVGSLAVVSDTALGFEFSSAACCD